VASVKPSFTSKTPAGTNDFERRKLAEQRATKRLKGDLEKSRALHYPQLEIIDNLFAEGNPAGVKACLKIKGVCDDYVRLPLVAISSERYQKLESLLK